MGSFISSPRTPIVLFLTLAALAFSAQPFQAQPDNYQRLKTQAEKYFEQKSYAKSHKLYLEADALTLPPGEARWVDFRVADTLWRAQAGSRTPDPSTYDKARRNLEVLVRDVQRMEDRDRVWAEVHESLGDFWWLRRDSKNWGAAWNHYQKALDWWAGARDLELARKRYLNIVWNTSAPPWREPYYYYGYHGNQLPLNILEGVLKIARTPEDRARAHYLLAMTLRNQGGWEHQQRVPEEFERAIQTGPASEWYDDALFYYAEWLTNYGEIIIMEDGRQRREMNYVKAVELYRKLLQEFRKGETRFYDDARRRIENITGPVLGISVSNIFLPNSEIEVHLNWRNIQRADLTLYPVDLTRHLDFPQGKPSSTWIQNINLRLRKKIKSWSEKTGDRGDFKPGQRTLQLDQKLPLGAYVLEATGGGVSARDLILVTDASLVLKTSGKQALVYFCDALDGSPLPKARVTLWERYYNGRKWVWRDRSAQTNPEGMAVFDLKDSSYNEDLFASAALNERQAFSTGNSYRSVTRRGQWKVYVFTDRPAYRPNETARWKVIARTYDGSVYSTPSRQTVEYQITDPRGSKLKEGTLRLNAFGSAWDSLKLTESVPLGAYQVTFWTPGRKKHIGSATLFRLEEYKLPEFKVAIQTPEEDGKKKTFRLGDPVEVTIQAEYYFGGPVANANVEVVVFQRPFHHHWRPVMEYPWYYKDMYSIPGYGWRGGGQRIKREVIKTDAAGRATLVFNTPRTSTDLEYRVEARVTDASRREVIASDTVRVTRQSHYVYLRPGHNIYRPQDKLKIRIKALDANNDAFQARGTVRVTRDYWFEIWIDPYGREVKGEELKFLREKSAVFPPPPPRPDSPPWRLKFQGYQHDEILTQIVKTNEAGEAELTFTPEREGYYRVAWSEQEKGAAPLQAETTVWVATPGTTDLGYRHGGLEIIVDKDTFRTGQKAPVMLSLPASGRYVLFSVEGDDLYSYRLVHVTGNVKLLELEITEKHVPNIFLDALMVSDRQIYQDSKQVVVPPADHFLKVKVESDREQYQPGDEGTFTVTTLDHKGRPVPAEVGFGVVDESVFYIQKELAPDPRKFFYGTKRTRRTRTQSTFQMKGYARLVRSDRGLLKDDRQVKRNEADRLGFADAFKEAGVGGALREASRARSQAALKSLAKKEGDIATEAAAPLGEGEAGRPAVQVRSDFRTTVFWQPDVSTGKDGKATVQVKFPDSVTQWRATARVVTRVNQFGIAKTATRTRKPLIVRLQAPRFFVAGDVLTVSALVNNNTDEAMTVLPSIQARGLVIRGRIVNGKTIGDKQEALRVPGRGEARLDWQVAVAQPGPVHIRVTALGQKHGDAMEKTFVAHEHGVEKLLAKSGKMRGDDLTVRLDLPAERKPASTRLTVQVTPSLAVTMLDAIPYLIDYPYGCTEQTMSRFLPAVITAGTLADLGLKPETVMERMFGGIEPAHVRKTHPRGKRDVNALDDMANRGLNRLYDFQHGDGGWGWWKKGESDHFMTAYVLWGMVLAQQAGTEVKRSVLQRAVNYLDKELVEEEVHFDVQAWMLHALSAYQVSAKRKGPDKFQARAFENLWNHRDRLNAYTRALLALSAHHFGKRKQARVLIENLENGVKIDKTPDTAIIQRGKKGKSHPAVLATAHWGEDGIYRRWSEGGVEATAFALRALLAIDPTHHLIEPVTHWLVKNRRGAHWSNTRDTAISVLAFNEYLRVSGELDTDIEYELLVNGKSIARTRVENPLQAPSRYAIDPKLIRDGANTIHIVRRDGKGPLYFSAMAEFFSKEEPIAPAGNEIFLRRQYYKLVGRPTLLKGYVYDKVPLEEGGTVTSGERVETVITIEAKNNYEYLVIEDLKPAGLEAVQLRSGESLYARELKSAAVKRKFKKTPGLPRTSSTASETIISPTPPDSSTDHTGRSRWVYQELRDRKTALFIDKLPEGVWEIRYTLRAEVPGKFHALPVLGHAMYIPEIRANGAEIRISVQDRE